MRNPQTASELNAHKKSISPSMPPPKVITKVYCRERTDTRASTRLTLRSIFTLRFPFFLAFEKFIADITI